MVLRLLLTVPVASAPYVDYSEHLVDDGTSFAPEYNDYNATLQSSFKSFEEDYYETYGEEINYDFLGPDSNLAQRKCPMLPPSQIKLVADDLHYQCLCLTQPWPSRPAVFLMMRFHRLILLLA